MLSFLKKEKKFIPEKIWKRYNKVSYKKDTRVEMPSRTVLKDQEQRTVLFWFRIRNWTDQQIINESAYRPHTPGGKESTLDQEIKKYSSK